MRGVVAVAVALLVSLMSSGCFVADDDPETQDADTSGTVTATGTTGTRTATTSRSATATAGTSGSGAANEAPTATLTATPVNGTAPLNVTFDIGGTDADSDNLTWSLTLDNDTLGDGTGVPAQVNHTFSEAGNFTVFLTVSDGTSNATANVTVYVTAGAEKGGVPIEDTLCPTFEDALEIPGTGMYITPQDTLIDPPFSAGFWIYEESNNMPGLQRDDDVVPTDCPTPDTIIF